MLTLKRNIDLIFEDEIATTNNYLGKEGLTAVKRLTIRWDQKRNTRIVNFEIDVIGKNICSDFHRTC